MVEASHRASIMLWFPNRYVMAPLRQGCVQTGSIAAIARGSHTTERLQGNKPLPQAAEPLETDRAKRQDALAH
jgi:hypothetical protein